MAGAFGVAPASQAEPRHAAAISSAQGSGAVRVAFSYDRTASAQEIYSDLQKTAGAACAYEGVRTKVIRRLEQRCARKMIESGIVQLDRSDIAQLHRGRIAVANR